MKSSLTVLVFLLMAIKAQASDGAIEINQACVSTGCFAGDGPGYPVEIDDPGSYVLTSDLVPIGIGMLDSMIQIQSSSVTLDLGGHSIRGPVVCTGDQPNCFAGDIRYGIFVAPADSNTLYDVKLQNGTVRGFDEDCILTFQTSNAIVRDMQVSNCGNRGIYLFQQTGRLERVSVSDCGGSGAIVGPQALVTESTFHNSRDVGIAGGVCRGNSFSSNDGAGGVSGEELCAVELGPNACNGSICP